MFKKKKKKQWDIQKKREINDTSEKSNVTSRVAYVDECHFDVTNHQPCSSAWLPPFARSVNQRGETKF